MVIDLIFLNYVKGLSTLQLDIKNKTVILHLQYMNTSITV